MKKPISRRLFLTAAAAVPLAACTPRSDGQNPPPQGQPQPSQPPSPPAPRPGGPLTRSEVRTAAGTAMLAKYAKAVGIMKNTATTPEGNPLSWKFQWFIHWTPDDKATLINQIYPQGNPANWKSVADKTWATCQAHFVPRPREPYFLPWHRRYVLSFEAIIKHVLQDNDFALPYWDYTRNPVLPDQFRMPDDPTFKPLFNDRPTNDGSPIDTAEALTRMMHDALCRTRYIGTSRLNAGFCDHLDANLHGTVHGEIGGDMESVPTAANDPIFWLHHCNIDRLWASWIAAGGKNPTDSTFLNEPFSFADTSGNASETTAGSVSVDDTAALGYTYDRLEARAADCPPFAQRETAAPPVVTHQLSGPLTLGGAPTVVALRPTGNAVREAAGARTLLIVTDVAAPTSPGTVYDVSVSLPASTNPAEREPRRVGQVNFFDLTSHQGHAGRTDQVFSFDVTGIVRSGTNPSVTITPRRPVRGDVRVTVGSVQLVRG